MELTSFPVFSGFGNSSWFRFMRSLREMKEPRRAIARLSGNKDKII